LSADYDTVLDTLLWSLNLIQPHSPLPGIPSVIYLFFL
jgi:hypothetical protein